MAVVDELKITAFQIHVAYVGTMENAYRSGET